MLPGTHRGYQGAASAGAGVCCSWREGKRGFHSPHPHPILVSRALSWNCLPTRNSHSHGTGIPSRRVLRAMGLLFLERGKNGISFPPSHFGAWRAPGIVWNCLQPRNPQPRHGNFREFDPARSSGCSFCGRWVCCSWSEEEKKKPGIPFLPPNFAAQRIPGIIWNCLPTRNSHSRHGNSRESHPAGLSRRWRGDCCS